MLRLWIVRGAAALPRGWLGATWRFLFLFIVFNSTVVLEDGLVRWLGLVGCLWVVLNSWRQPSLSGIA